MIPPDIQINRESPEGGGDQFQVKHHVSITSPIKESSEVPEVAHNLAPQTIISPSLAVDPRNFFVTVVRVNTVCSLRCLFCGYSRDVQRPRSEMSWELVQNLGRLLQQYQTHDPRPALVSWLGGEPFQWSHWRAASEHFRHDLELQLSVTTNGLALRRSSIRSAALNLFRQITISIDGLAAHHDALRQAPGMFDSLREVVRSLNQDRSREQTLLRVNTVLTRENIGTFGLFCQTVAQWGVDELTFNPLGGNDRPDFFPSNRLLPEQLAWFCARLSEWRANCLSLGLRICGSDGYLRRMVATAVGQALPILDCGPGEDFLFVDERGHLSPCSFTSGQYPTKLDGSQGFEKREWRLAFQRVRQTNCPKSCQDCHANHVFEKFG